jgi:hypothetical protein
MFSSRASVFIFLLASLLAQAPSARSSDLPALTARMTACISLLGQARAQSFLMIGRARSWNGRPPFLVLKGSAGATEGFLMIKPGESSGEFVALKQSEAYLIKSHNPAEGERSDYHDFEATLRSPAYGELAVSLTDYESSLLFHFYSWGNESKRYARKPNYSTNHLKPTAPLSEGETHEIVRASLAGALRSLRDSLPNRVNESVRHKAELIAGKDGQGGLVQACGDLSADPEVAQEAAALESAARAARAEG